MAKDKRQGMINDIRLEDPELVELLAERPELVEAATRLRQVNADIKKLLVERHERAINSDRDGEHSGYVTCGPYRWQPRRTKVDATTKQKTVVTNEGFKWAALEIFEMDLSPDAGVGAVK